MMGDAEAQFIKRLLILSTKFGLAVIVVISSMKRSNGTACCWNKSSNASDETLVFVESSLLDDILGDKSFRVSDEVDVVGVVIIFD